MNSTTKRGLTLRPLAGDDEPAVLALLGAALAGGPTGERTSAFFRWKHMDNPFGRSYGLVATDDETGQLIGVRLFLRWQLRAGTTTVPAVRAVDTATHPDHQGRGIFTKLTLRALDDLDTEGVALVFNTPNAASKPGYLKMGWQEVGDLPVRLRPVRPLRVLRGVAAGAGQSAVTEVGEPIASRLALAGDVLRSRRHEVEDLLEAADAAPTGCLHTDRSFDYLDWRYAAPPGMDYRAIPIERQGLLVGLGLGRLRRRGGLTELTLSEVLVRPGDTASARSVLRGAALAGVDHVAAMLDPIGLGAVGLRAGYIRVPRHGLTLVTNPRRWLALDPTRPDAWRLTLGDLEVF